MVTVSNYDDELVKAYKAGEISDSYVLPPVEEGDYMDSVWFTDEEKEMYEVEDGFFPRCNRFEFTSLWYAIIGQYLDEIDLGDWSVEHGGLRWESYKGSGFSDRATMNEIYLTTFETYKRLYDRLVREGAVELENKTV